MTIFRVNYDKKNFGRFFGGSNNYYDNTNKFFTTREKAEAFVNEEEKEYVLTLGKDAVVKPTGEGKIFEEIVE